MVRESRTSSAKSRTTSATAANEGVPVELTTTVLTSSSNSSSNPDPPSTTAYTTTSSSSSSSNDQSTSNLSTNANSNDNTNTVTAETDTSSSKTRTPRLLLRSKGVTSNEKTTLSSEPNPSSSSSSSSNAGNTTKIDSTVDTLNIPETPIFNGSEYYGNIVWAQQQGYPWFPAVIVHPSRIPKAVYTTYENSKLADKVAVKFFPFSKEPGQKDSYAIVSAIKKTKPLDTSDKATYVQAGKSSKFASNFDLGLEEAETEVTKEKSTRTYALEEVIETPQSTGKKRKEKASVVKTKEETEGENDSTAVHDKDGTTTATTASSSSSKIPGAKLTLKLNKKSKPAPEEESTETKPVDEKETEENDTTEISNSSSSLLTTKNKLKLSLTSRKKNKTSTITTGDDTTETVMDTEEKPSEAVTTEDNTEMTKDSHRTDSTAAIARAAAKDAATQEKQKREVEQYAAMYQKAIALGTTTYSYTSAPTNVVLPTTTVKLPKVSLPTVPTSISSTNLLSSSSSSLAAIASGMAPVLGPEEERRLEKEARRLAKKQAAMKSSSSSSSRKRRNSVSSASSRSSIGKAEETEDDKNESSENEKASSSSDESVKMDTENSDSDDAPVRSNKNVLGKAKAKKARHDNDQNEDQPTEKVKKAQPKKPSGPIQKYIAGGKKSRSDKSSSSSKSEKISSTTVSSSTIEKDNKDKDSASIKLPICPYPVPTAQDTERAITLVQSCTKALSTHNSAELIQLLDSIGNLPVNADLVRTSKLSEIIGNLKSYATSVPESFTPEEKAQAQLVQTNAINIIQRMRMVCKALLDWQNEYDNAVKLKEKLVKKEQERAERKEAAAKAAAELASREAVQKETEIPTTMTVATENKVLSEPPQHMPSLELETTPETDDTVMNVALSSKDVVLPLTKPTTTVSSFTTLSSNSTIPNKPATVTKSTPPVSVAPRLPVMSAASLVKSVGSSSTSTAGASNTTASVRTPTLSSSVTTGVSEEDMLRPVPTGSSVRTLGISLIKDALIQICHNRDSKDAISITSSSSVISPSSSSSSSSGSTSLLAVNSSVSRIIERLSVYIEHHLYETPKQSSSTFPAAVFQSTMGSLFSNDHPSQDDAYMRIVRSFLLLLDSANESRPDAKIIRDRTADPTKRFIVHLYDVSTRTKMAVATSGNPSQFITYDTNNTLPVHLFPHEKELINTLIPLVYTVLSSAVRL